MCMDLLPVELLNAIFVQVQAEDLAACDCGDKSLCHSHLRSFVFLMSKIMAGRRSWERSCSNASCSFLDETHDNDHATLDWHRNKSRTLLPSAVAFLTRRPDIAASVRSLALTQENCHSIVTDVHMLLVLLNLLPSLCCLELIDVCVGRYPDPSDELVVDRHQP